MAEAVYKDAVAKCVADVSDFRDLKTIRSRIKDEGLSFLTITLPNFCRDLERALEFGVVDAKLFSRWKRAKDSVMPAFLQGITRHIFDVETGKVISYEIPPTKVGGPANDISIYLDSVRQICLTFKKVEIDCSPSRVAAAFQGFLEIEQSFDDFQLSDADTDAFLSVSAVLWDNMVRNFRSTDVIPRHGPGATAERVSGNQKYAWLYWHDRLEPYFPLIDTAYPLGTPLDSKELADVTIVPEHLEQPVRVVGVPKTLKAPRIIAIEPCCMQYTQQGIRDYLYSRLESYWLTRGHINFRDQRVNQSLAVSASKDGQLATIDLSDASDRVPRDLALKMFRSCPDLMDSIDACRSTRAELPDGSIYGPLRKFASMGSALCFPVEAMYFYTICVIALLKDMNLSVTARNVFKVSRLLYVYGDDIIVPTTNATVVLDYLRKYNCKVNTNKTFYLGKFRESCGVDAFDGEPVTPVYLRQVCPKNKRQVRSIISWVATRNLFYKKGYWQTAQLMQDKINRIVGDLPYVPEDSPGLGYYSFLGYCSASRWNNDFQRLEVKTLVPTPVNRTDQLDGYGALMKFFIQKSRDADPSIPSVESSLTHSALRGSVILKNRWVRAT
jgi:hypothetical protein